MNDEELKQLIIDSIVTTREAMEILNCSRQNIDDLIKRGKLTPIKKWDRDKLFLKSDILARLEQPE
ncbi:helix-turn-helix domain-containing protein [Anaerospora hongkongensis]|uniref:helix-turn-helix domain-containing protein n=1 Tax=Anaerospora hongkongensis TaxID=244830 RepID=UPI0028A06C75|nr:helix-turn-helix domain-containing protein [Anaerospora hongkongensis]